ncbi:hypothetical protein ACOSQ3_029688 [Xanthoceras sorbifolium]
MDLNFQQVRTIQLLINGPPNPESVGHGSRFVASPVTSFRVRWTWWTGGVACCLHSKFSYLKYTAKPMEVQVRCFDVLKINIETRAKINRNLFTITRAKIEWLCNKDQTRTIRVM